MKHVKQAFRGLVPSSKDRQPGLEIWQVQLRADIVKPKEVLLQRLSDRLMGSTIGLSVQSSDTPPAPTRADVANFQICLSETTQGRENFQWQKRHIEAYLKDRAHWTSITQRDRVIVYQAVDVPSRGVNSATAQPGPSNRRSSSDNLPIPVLRRQASSEGLIPLTTLQYGEAELQRDAVQLDSVGTWTISLQGQASQPARRSSPSRVAGARQPSPIRSYMLAFLLEYPHYNSPLKWLRETEALYSLTLKTRDIPKKDGRSMCQCVFTGSYAALQGVQNAIFEHFSSGNGWEKRVWQAGERHLRGFAAQSRAANQLSGSSSAPQMAQVTVHLYHSVIFSPMAELRSWVGSYPNTEISYQSVDDRGNGWRVWQYTFQTYAGNAARLQNHVLAELGKSVRWQEHPWRHGVTAWQCES